MIQKEIPGMHEQRRRQQVDTQLQVKKRGLGKKKSPLGALSGHQASERLDWWNLHSSRKQESLHLPSKTVSKLSFLLISS